jgi:hypothetical protein
MRRLRPVVAAALALALAGCGFGPGEPEKGAAELRVTRDFGQRQLGPPGLKDAIRPADTVMRFLQSERRVTTRYGGNFVQSIDGLAGNKQAAHDWFFYVNGRESSAGAADVKLAASDVVQWDYHRWTATMHIPIIVGAFPEPFVHGFEGRRLPTRVECADPAGRACDDTLEALERQSITAAAGPLGASAGENSIRVIVAPWDEAREIITGRVIEKGPRVSGVYARFGSDGGLDLLDGAGRVAREAAPGTGLVAATQLPGESVAWLVTGNDDDGVERAAQALDPAKLRNAFAVAVTPTGVVRLPVGGL